MGKRKPCEWNGIRYKTLTAAAAANYITPMGMHYRLARGYRCDDDLPRWNKKYEPLCKPCEWNGVEYPSVKAAAAARGVSQSLMSLHLSKGYTCDADVKPPGGRRVPVRFRGAVYPSMRSAARACKVSVTMVRNHSERLAADGA